MAIVPPVTLGEDTDFRKIKVGDKWVYAFLSATEPEDIPDGFFWIDTSVTFDQQSLYDLAVANGFVGTVQEYLDSLVGPEGPEGSQGIQGDPGPEGPQGDPGVAVVGSATSPITDANTVRPVGDFIVWFANVHPNNAAATDLVVRVDEAV